MADVISLVSRGRDLATLAVSIAVLLALLFVADILIERRPFFGRPFWALVDSAVHGLVALLVTAPIIHSASSPQLLGIAFLAGTLVDVDHFLVARSRSFWTATHLEKRPPTHSLTFALLVSGGGHLFSRSLATDWVVFSALASHVLCDASAGTAPVLWPLGKRKVPRWDVGCERRGCRWHPIGLCSGISRNPLTQFQLNCGTMLQGGL
jgi:hypothetical protein